MQDDTKPALRRIPLRLQKKTVRTLLDEELDQVGGGTFGGVYTGTEGGWNCWSPSFFEGGAGGGGSCPNH